MLFIKKFWRQGPCLRRTKRGGLVAERFWDGVGRQRSTVQLRKNAEYFKLKNFAGKSYICSGPVPGGDCTMLCMIAILRYRPPMLTV